MKDFMHWRVLFGVFRVVLSLAGFGGLMLLVGTFSASALSGKPIYGLLAVATGFLAIAALATTVNQANLLYQASGRNAAVLKLS